MPTAYSYVRFSTPEQAKGDSLRRQLDKSEEYAQQKNLTLDTSFRDEGVSAYRGKNFHAGALGRFLAAVESGTVAKGSWLLVESLDRLSRDSLNKALPRFLDIINSGITIATLSDGKEYSEDADDMSLMLSLLIFMRANEESATKSKRLSATWENKRQEAATGAKKATSIGPRWLRLSDDRTVYEPITDRVSVVQRIYELAADGHGSDAIARRLNSEGIAPFGRPPKVIEGQSARPPMWAKSSVTKVLQNRSVLGEYSPTVARDGKRVPAGEPIKSYYPAVIDQPLFDAVQAARQSRRLAGRGPKGKTFSNLFTGIAKCGLCGSSLHFTDKASAKDRASRRPGTPRSDAYLVCSAAQAGDSDCTYGGYRYDIVELALLSSLAELDFVSIIRDGRPEQERQLESIANRIHVAQAQLKQTLTEEANLMKAVEAGGSIAALLEGLSQKDTLKKRQQREVEQLQQDQTAVQSAATRAQETARDFESAYASMSAEQDTEELYSLRTKLHSRIGSLVEHMDVVDWPHEPDLSVELFPDGPLKAFWTAKRTAKVLVITYRLRDEGYRVRGRFLIVNVGTRQVFEGLEVIPHDTEGFVGTQEEARAAAELYGDDAAAQSVSSFVQTLDYPSDFVRDTRFRSLDGGEESVTL